MNDRDDGLLGWRDEDGHRKSPIASGYECEDETWRAARAAAFNASGLAESERPLFEGGWAAAHELKGPWPPYATEAMHGPWLKGWHAWPGRKWEDPYTGFTEDYARRMAVQDQDEARREISRKSKKERRTA